MTAIADGSILNALVRRVHECKGRYGFWTEVVGGAGVLTTMCPDADLDGKAEEWLFFIAGRLIACSRGVDGDGYHDVMVDGMTAPNPEVRKIARGSPEAGPFTAIDMNARAR